MKLSVSGDSALESFMGYNGTPGDSSNGMIESVTAQNAKLTVNNVEIENSSNTISDSLEDITLNLNDVTGESDARRRNGGAGYCFPAIWFCPT